MDSKLKKELDTLKQRVEELECATDVDEKKLGIIDEVFDVLGEFPLGHALINRATNRSKLRYLKCVVIPRREKALLKLALDDSIPEPIKKQFTKDEINLIIRARRAAKHREGFETRSSHFVKNAFHKLQSFLDKKFKKRNLIH